MSQNSARIDSPDVIKDFRVQLIKFDEVCRQSVAGIRSDVHHAMQWLQHDQMSHWKQEYRKAEELVRQAKSEYLLARYGATNIRKPSYVDEQKALRRAEMKKETCEKKMAAVKRW